MAPGPERWATVERLYHEALTRPVGGRSAFLAEACAGDDDLRREVESLLAQRASGDDALGRGAVVAAARLISDVDRLYSVPPCVWQRRDVDDFEWKAGDSPVAANALQ
jgi:hypothetical protein